MGQKKDIFTCFLLIRIFFKDTKKEGYSAMEIIVLRAKVNARCEQSPCPGLCVCVCLDAGDQ